MRDHARVSPQFWLGETGRALRGDPAAQVVALYLITCPSANAFGLFHLSVASIQHETGLKEPSVRKALEKISRVGFASYDANSELCWVPNMAKMQIATHLKPLDNRIKALAKQLAPFAKTPYFADFMARYGVAYHLDGMAEKGAPKAEKREGVPEGASEAPSKGLPEGASKIYPQGNAKYRYAYPAAFENWWKRYPAERRVGKRKTCDAWIAAGRRLRAEHGWTQGETIAFLQDRVECYARSPAGRRVKYVPHSHRWLEHGRYDDDPASWEDVRETARARTGEPGRAAF